MFVRTPDAPNQPEPIVVPAPQHQTSIYVLTKNEELEQKVLEAPSQPASAPQVHYVAYDEGESLEEVDGHDLRAAFNNAAVGNAAEGFSTADSDENRFAPSATYGFP